MQSTWIDSVLNSLPRLWFRPSLGLKLSKVEISAVKNLILRHNYEICVCVIAKNN